MFTRNTHPIHWEKNKITVSGSPSSPQIPIMSKAYDVCAIKKGYQDIEIDFTHCQSVFEVFMLPLVCLARFYLINHKVSTTLKLPNDSRLKGLFYNCNWQHFISPTQFEASTYQGTQHVPAFQFKNADEQFQVVDRLMDVAIASLQDLDRESLKALEWAINEITDNVINHAESAGGGFVQASTFSENKTIEFVVADAGLGIPKTLNITNHRKALEQAIKEGITRNKATNQGNGLFGTYQIATLSGGRFELHSGRETLVAQNGEVKFHHHPKSQYNGTIALVKINCAKPNLLEEALRFDDKPHDPGLDYIDQKYSDGAGNNLVFKLKEESKSFGSREAAIPVKNKINNILKNAPNSSMTIDCNGVYLISSSFADEVFGKLFSTFGPMEFMSRISFKNLDKTVKGLIDRAIKQRSSLS